MTSLFRVARHGIERKREGCQVFRLQSRCPSRLIKFTFTRSPEMCNSCVVVEREKERRGTLRCWVDSTPFHWPTQLCSRFKRRDFESESHRAQKTLREFLGARHSLGGRCRFYQVDRFILYTPTRFSHFFSFFYWQFAHGIFFSCPSRSLFFIDINCS